ncbi:hypothetical protein BX070DRAFT_220245 [Coemansia spiralis]|nr:hypothetical protein BX070DRAFT_220245 [Coemansia spiralis]
MLASSNNRCLRCAASGQSKTRGRRYAHKYASLSSVKLQGIIWKPGRQQQEDLNSQDTTDFEITDVELIKKIKYARKGPLGGYPYAMYATAPSSTVQETQRQQQIGNNGNAWVMPNVVPKGSELHNAFISMPISRQGIKFNPWSLLLELLDDSRLTINVDKPIGSRGRTILTAIEHLGWVTPGNMLAQRPLITQHLLKMQTIRRSPQSTAVESNKETIHSNNELLTPSQNMVLSQIQLPRYITQKYERSRSVMILNQDDTADEVKRTQWDRIWLSTNLAILELQATFIKHRVVFNSRLDATQQSQLLIKSAFEHAPGFVLNVIMSWCDDYSRIVNTYMAGRLCLEYFGSTNAIREVITQAWQMYDWLVYHSPHYRKGLQSTSSSPYDKAVPDIDNAWITRNGSVAELLYRSLTSFDNWAEIDALVDKLQQSHTNASNPALRQIVASDHRLIERYLELEPQRRGYLRH